MLPVLEKMRHTVRGSNTRSVHVHVHSVLAECIPNVINEMSSSKSVVYNVTSYLKYGCGCPLCYLMYNIILLLFSLITIIQRHDIILVINLHTEHCSLSNVAMAFDC